MFKFTIIATILVLAKAVPIQVYHEHGPTLLKAVAPVVKTIEYEAPAAYDFSYSVHDPHTGDIKSQSESRKGDVVHGSYSLIDSDGHQRTVEYTADAHHGFNAVVHRTPTNIKIPQPVHKVVHAPIAHYAPVAHYSAPVAHHHYAAPALHHYAAPALHHYAAPAVHHSYIAPVAKVAVPVAHGPSHVSFSTPHHSYHY